MFTGVDSLACSDGNSGSSFLQTGHVGDRKNSSVA